MDDIGTTADVCRLAVGNKCDLTGKRAVNEDEGVALACMSGITFMETSAGGSLNVESIFVVLATAMTVERAASPPTQTHRAGTARFGMTKR